MKVKEIWLDVVGFEGLYKVSNLGRVWSVGADKPLVLFIHLSGYQYCRLYKDQGRKTLWVHRVVATAFIPNPSHKKTVHHKDHNKSNNKLINLCWATHSENLIFYRLSGGEVKRAKLNADKAKEIKGLILEGRDRASIAIKYGVSVTAIRNIQFGVTYTYV